MNDHNLDDLIIDTIAPKNNKTKSLLTIIALLIVVLIVAIILTKTLLKSPDNSDLMFEENLSEMIAPELKLQEPTEITKPAKESPSSQVIEEEVKAPVIHEVKKPEIKETISLPTTPKKVETVTSPITQKPKIKIDKPKEVKESIKPIVTSKPIKKIKPVIKPMIKKPIQTHKTTKPHSGKKYYVQVGSFKDSPSPRFLSVIKSSGFKYYISKPDATGYKKLLIGPYNTRTEVDKARQGVRDRIHKSAFVVQK